MFYEFCCIYEILTDEIRLNHSIPSGKKKDYFALAYGIFVNGVFNIKGKDILEQNKLTHHLCKKLETDEAICRELIIKLNLIQNSNTTPDQYFLFNQYGKYKDILFFDGHRERVSFSVNHLAQIINYISSDGYLHKNERFITP